MSEENIRHGSTGEGPSAEKSAQPTESTSDLTDEDKAIAAYRIYLERGGAEGNPDDDWLQGKHDLAKGSDELIHVVGRSGAIEDLNIMTISAGEFEQLSNKTSEILQEAALAFERIGKDQDEIVQLKTETRAMLARLRAA